MMESTPVYPDAGRYWDMVERHKITILYSAPTVIRTLMKFGDDYVTKYNRSSLRALASVGEPLNPESHKWFHEVVGEGRCEILDTFFQTETGGHVITPLSSMTPIKPGFISLPFLGIQVALLEPSTGKLISTNESSGVLCISSPWPGMARTIFGDHGRFVSTYFKPYPGYYFTGDGAYRDKDGYYLVTGRVDDVINVSGHRIGSAEIENELVTHPSIAEAAVIGIPHNIKGSSLFAYVTPKDKSLHLDPDTIIKELKLLIRSSIGAFCIPDDIILTPSLPKTRSGKIMRRLLRKIASRDSSDTFGDTTTLVDESIIQILIDKVAELNLDNK